MERVLAGLNRIGISFTKPVMLLVVLMLLGWILNTPGGLLGKADAVGYAVCHRIDLRSFHLGDRPLPLCARCTGMYLGAMVGLVYQAFLGRRRTGTPPVGVLVALAVLVIVFAVDGLNSYLHLFPAAPSLYEPQNWSRLLTGTGMGLVIAIALYPAFNQSVWREWDHRPAIGGFVPLVGLLALALFVDVLVLTENPLLLYPLSLVSAAGVLILLTMVYSMVWLMVFRTENTNLFGYRYLYPLVGGFGLALLQILLLDFARYLLTGTWDGFHIG
jgi:uncharacterized membrane protein